jgi:hypothetical protein
MLGLRSAAKGILDTRICDTLSLRPQNPERNRILYKNRANNADLFENWPEHNF